MARSATRSRRAPRLDPKTSNSADTTSDSAARVSGRGHREQGGGAGVSVVLGVEVVLGGVDGGLDLGDLGGWERVG